jgi:hypothetical protein
MEGGEPGIIIGHFRTPLGFTVHKFSPVAFIIYNAFLGKVTLPRTPTNRGKAGEVVTSLNE